MVDMPQRDTHMGPQDLQIAPDGSNSLSRLGLERCLGVDKDLQT